MAKNSLIKNGLANLLIRCKAITSNAEIKLKARLDEELAQVKT